MKRKINSFTFIAVNLWLVTEQSLRITFKQVWFKVRRFSDSNTRVFISQIFPKLLIFYRLILQNDNAWSISSNR